jgi:hypothetical protein
MLYNVPATRNLVITDLEYSFLIDSGQFGNRLETPVILRQGATDRWSSWAMAVILIGATPMEMREMVHKSFSTGVAFPPGSQANLYHTPGAHSGQIGALVRWRISWTGYLVQSAVMGADDAPGLGSGDLGLELETNVPNPFLNETSIRFSLPEAAHITLRIIDVQGRVVRTLLDGPEVAGDRQLTWDGRDDAGRSVAAGEYFIDLAAPNGRQSRKAIAID